MEKFYTTGQFAAALGVRYETVDRWMLEKRLKPAHYTPGGHCRFSQAQLDEVRAVYRKGQWHWHHHLSPLCRPEQSDAERAAEMRRAIAKILFRWRLRRGHFDRRAAGPTDSSGSAVIGQETASRGADHD